MDLQKTFNNQELKKVEAKRCLFCDSHFLRSHSSFQLIDEPLNYCESCGKVQQMSSTDSFWQAQLDYYPHGEFLFVHWKLSWGMFWRTSETLNYLDRVSKRVKRLLSHLSSGSLELSARALFHYELKAIYSELDQKNILLEQKGLIKKFYSNEAFFLKEYSINEDAFPFKRSAFRLFIFTFSLMLTVYFIFRLIPV